MKTKHTFVVKYRNKRIGRVEGDTLKKRVTRSRHFYRAVGGYAIQAAVVDDLLRHGVRWVEITERDTGATYRAPLRRFVTDGVRINAGHGDQMCLPLDRFEREANPQISIFELFEEVTT